MADMTPNEGVPTVESAGFFVGDQLYKMYLRALVIEKLDDPGHIWDDRVLAMMDGAFDYN